MREVVFRPRIMSLVWNAALMTMVAYVALRVLGRNTPVPYPFGIAAVIGGGSFLWNLLRHARKHGIRADENGLVDIHSGVALRWSEITAIKLDVEKLQSPKGAFHVRVATVVAGERTIRFAALAMGWQARVGTIVNIETAGMLLALVTARTQATALYPPTWIEAAPEPELAPSQARKLDAARAGGLGALAWQLAPKVGSIAVKLLKSIKLGTVAIAVGAYALIWSWQFAIALVGMVLVHECGHAFAMWRSGVPVKGIYFIPFFGGAAVSQGIAKTRAKSAYIAINGPVWGTLLALACLAIFAITGEQHAFSLAAWGALLNLFNLLPIFPLDGGRIIASLAHASPRGVPIVASSLALGAIVAYFTGLQLLLIVGFLGLFEFGGRLVAATYAPALALLGRPLTAEEHEVFARHVAYVELNRDAPAQRDARMALFAHRKAEAEQTPMTFRQGAFALAGYLVLVGVLLSILFITAHVGGPGSPLQFLR